MPRLPRYPYVVLDMNLTRRVDVVADLVRDFDRHGQLIVLPRIWSYESTKSTTTALGTFVRSTELFLERPEAFAVATPPVLLRACERRWRRVAELGDIIDRKQTEDFRLILRDQRGGGRATAERLETYAVKNHEWWMGVMTRRDGPKLVRGLAALFDAIYKEQRVVDASVPAPDLLHPLMKAARRGLKTGDRAPFRALLLAMASHRTIAAFLESMGYGHRTARRVAADPCFSFSEYIVQLSVAFHWVLMRGLDTQTDEKIDNTLADTEYAQTALFGRGLVSEDGWLLDVHADLHDLVPRLWP